jgi:hypothetical protein
VVARGEGGVLNELGGVEIKPGSLTAFGMTIWGLRATPRAYSARRASTGSTAEARREGK